MTQMITAIFEDGILKPLQELNLITHQVVRIELFFNVTRNLTRMPQQYLILHDSYVLGKLNRDIMAKLYIGEGTFNRARRRAIRGVARALEEMEREAQRRSQA